jgi:quinol monooxygenase YgiN
MLIVLVKVTVKREALEEFESAILENAARALADEPGCLRFDVSRREDDPTEWLFYEMYADGAAFEAHRASAHFAKYQTVADRVLTSKTLIRYVTRNVVAGRS